MIAAEVVKQKIKYLDTVWHSNYIVTKKQTRLILQNLRIYHANRSPISIS
jgi:ureidoglycolate hydrolase